MLRSNNAINIDAIYNELTLNKNNTGDPLQQLMMLACVAAVRAFPVCPGLLDTSSISSEVYVQRLEFVNERTQPFRKIAAEMYRRALANIRIELSKHALTDAGKTAVFNLMISFTLPTIYALLGHTKEYRFGMCQERDFAAMHFLLKQPYIESNNISVEEVMFGPADDSHNIGEYEFLVINRNQQSKLSLKSINKWGSHCWIVDAYKGHGLIFPSDNLYPTSVLSRVDLYPYCKLDLKLGNVCKGLSAKEEEVFTQWKQKILACKNIEALEEWLVKPNNRTLLNKTVAMNSSSDKTQAAEQPPAVVLNDLRKRNTQAITSAPSTVGLKKGFFLPAEKPSAEPTGDDESAGSKKNRKRCCGCTVI